MSIINHHSPCATWGIATDDQKVIREARLAVRSQRPSQHPLLLGLRGHTIAWRGLQPRCGFTVDGRPRILWIFTRWAVSWWRHEPACRRSHLLSQLSVGWVWNGHPTGRHTESFWVMVDHSSCSSYYDAFRWVWWCLPTDRKCCDVGWL